MHRSRFTFSLTARLDRFARVVDQRWCTIAGGTDVERVKFGYDRDSDKRQKGSGRVSGLSALQRSVFEAQLRRWRESYEFSMRGRCTM